MKNVLILLKQKFFYVFLVVAYVMYSAMTYNREYNSDKLAKYYGIPEGVSAQKSSEGETMQAVKVESEEINEIIKFAEDQLGKPYGYALKGPDAFDCSGFTGYVFKEFDHRLSASSKLQAVQGVSVSQRELRSGDLVFFITPTSDNGDIDHVGIVVSVGHESIKFIHSSTGQGVVIDDLIQNKYYSSCYVGARRVIGVS